MEILDTAGQEELAPPRTSWARFSFAFLLVYDITSRSSFEEIAGLLDIIRDIRREENIVPVLVGNKLDLADARQVRRGGG